MGICHIFSPAALALARSLSSPRLIGAEDADVDVGQGDDDSAGQRGGVNQMRCAELLGVVDAIGQDQAAFGVGVEHFNRFAGHGDLDVAGLLRFAAGHVFGGGNQRRYFDVGLELRRWRA